MRIIIPVVSFGRSGGCRVLSKLANEFVRKGHEVIFIVPGYNGEPYYPTDAKVVSVRSRFGNVRFVRVFFGLLAIWREISNMKQGYVVANHNLTAFIAAALPKSFKKIYYIQAYEVKLVSSTLEKLIAYSSYFLPLRKIVNSDHILPKYFGDVVGVVPAGVDLSLFGGEFSAYDQTRSIRIGCVGRAERYKGTQEIVDAFVALAGRYDIVLNVAINMPKIPGGFKDLVRHRCIENDMQLSEFYKDNDIIIATGLIEDGAFHYPCAEGMAAGKVVISNYAPLISTLVLNDSPFKLKRVTEKAIIKALESALNLSKKEQAVEVKRNKELVQGYSWEDMGEKFIKLIASDH